MAGARRSELTTRRSELTEDASASGPGGVKGREIDAHKYAYIHICLHINMLTTAVHTVYRLAT